MVSTCAIASGSSAACSALPIAYPTTKALRPVLINPLINLVADAVSANRPSA
jgi:hypothetical protein